MKRTDASTDVKLNGITLPDGRVVSWADAFPRLTMPVTVPVERREAA